MDTNQSRPRQGTKHPVCKCGPGRIPGTGREAYSKFLQQTAESIKAEAAKKQPSPQGPKSIGKVFAARHLSKSGPVSYGNAAFGFEDIMFVYVGVYLQNGERAMNRTMVIKDRDGNWYVHRRHTFRHSSAKA